MEWKNKILIISGVVLFLFCVLFIIKKQNDIINHQKLINESFVEQKKLSNSVVRSESTYATNKEIDDLIKSKNFSIEELKEELSKLRAELKSISTVKIVTVTQNKTDQVSTVIDKEKEQKPLDPSNPDPYGYWKNRQTLYLTENFGNKTAPFGSVSFSASKDKPWSYEIKQRQYRLDSVSGLDEEGKTYTFNKFSIVSDGKTYDLDINESKTVNKLPESRFYLNPRVFLAVDGGAYLNKVGLELSPSAKLFIFSYGKTKPDPSMVFLGVGVGYSSIGKNLNFSITPIAYNIGHHIPLINNLFIAPSLSIDFFGNYTIMGGINVGL